MERINFSRLKQAIETSSEIGKIPDNGLCRLALTDEDKKMRDIFKKWMEDEKLATRVDDFGNMYGRREGTNADATPVLIGSHLDTQPQGGRFDGVLGVLIGLEVIRTLNENNIKTYRPIELVNFTNEEGARFEPPLLASGGLAGVFSKQFVYNIADRDGYVFEDELARIGYKGSENNRIEAIHSFLELHIEQGPVLENEQISIGAVQGIKGMSWLELTVKGEGGHAGPTPMTMRKDALMAASRLIVHIEEKSKLFDQELSVTAGRMSLEPNVVNCIPEEVVFSLDVRHLDDDKRCHFINELLNDLNGMAAEREVEMKTETLWEVDTTYFNSHIVSQVVKSAEMLGYTNRKLYSGAGHDAKYMNNMAPTGMVFLPSVDGKSHVESELTLDNDIEKGANVLFDSVRQLAEMEKPI